MQYIDIHSHLNIKPLTEDLTNIVMSLQEKEIKTITVGVDYETSKQAILFAQHYPDVLFATVGKHPNDNIDEIFMYDKYLEQALNDKVVAIGECGLDYFRLPNNIDEIEKIKNSQKGLFLEHIKLAKETNKPLMIHARPAKAGQDPSKDNMDAYTDVLDILEENNFNLKVNFHFFVGNIEIAKRIIKNNWSMSFDGPITFSTDYDEVISYIPIEHIMCETDAPFAAPVPYRGQICKPMMVIEIYKKIADIKSMELETVREIINSNVYRIFGIK